MTAVPRGLLTIVRRAWAFASGLSTAMIPRNAAMPRTGINDKRIVVSYSWGSGDHAAFEEPFRQVEAGLGPGTPSASIIAGLKRFRILLSAVPERFMAGAHFV
jgi:hypothetical protein